MSDKPKNEDYEVGYKKPPKHTRFKTGQSGNPKGRRKDSRNFLTLLNEELESKIHGTDENGKRITLSKKEALIKKMVNGAVKGDQKSTAMIIQHCQKLENRERDLELIRDAEDIDWSDPEAPYKAWLAAMASDGQKD